VNIQHSRANTSFPKYYWNSRLSRVSPAGIVIFTLCVLYYRVTRAVNRLKFRRREASPLPTSAYHVFRRDFKCIINIERERERERERTHAGKPPVISHIALCSRRAARVGIRSIGSMCLCRPAASDASDTVLVKSACLCRQHAELCLWTCLNQAWHGHVSCP